MKTREAQYFPGLFVLQKNKTKIVSVSADTLRHVKKGWIYFESITK